MKIKGSNKLTSQTTKPSTRIQLLVHSGSGSCSL